jgi:hypothetical protein
MNSHWSILPISHTCLSHTPPQHYTSRHSRSHSPIRQITRPTSTICSSRLKDSDQVEQSNLSVPITLDPSFKVVKITISRWTSCFVMAVTRMSWIQSTSANWIGTMVVQVSGSLYVSAPALLLRELKLTIRHQLKQMAK